MAKKAFSATELTQAYLANMEKARALNAYIVETPDRALAMAAESDRRIAAGKARALEGVPLGIKDLFATRGVHTQAASHVLDAFKPTYDSTVTANLFGDGAVMLGKLNMDEFAMGSSNETSYYGPVKNPWDLNTVPGGSSGGSAAAVAARLTPAATGTDTGGSIRQPAAFCGISGIKPTYGLVSRWGMIAFASSLDQGGPMARTAEDCALLLEAMSGFDDKDSTSLDRPVENYAANLNNDIRGLRIGLPKEFFDAGLDNDVAQVVQAAVDEYRKLGAEIKEISLPNMQLSVPVYYVVAPAECSSNLARFDGVRYGYRCENPRDLSDLYTRSRGEGFGAEVQRRILIGTYALSAGYYDAYYLKAQQIRRLIGDDFKRAFQDVDVILGPTAPSVAFRFGAKSGDPVAMYLSDIYTIAVNLAGLPAMSIPAGFAQNLPVGMQLIGPHFSEGRLLNAAHRYQQVSDWHRRTPPGFA
ncbi:MAG TPA: Asp-tRNA(Asn)/Glu-tRNA(Gln) amidotransferase subunit GatA [Methylococcaceae bacterium]|nr:Asp-tRNA(Asn)/Glu-tRNA(Gln) amidotransferase subunit GatA [Methylococcaceae bacterium]